MGDGSPSRFDSKGKGRARPTNGDVLSMDLDAAEEGGSAMNGQYQQMQMVEQQVCQIHPICHLSQVRSSGHLPGLSTNCNRVYRIHYLGTGSDFQSTGHHGCRTARNGPTY